MNHMQITARTDRYGCILYTAAQAAPDPAKRRKRAIKKLVYKDNLSWLQAIVIVDALAEMEADHG